MTQKCHDIDDLKVCLCHDIDYCANFWYPPFQFILEVIWWKSNWEKRRSKDILTVNNQRVFTKISIDPKTGSSSGSNAIKVAIPNGMRINQKHPKDPHRSFLMPKEGALLISESDLKTRHSPRLAFQPLNGSSANPVTLYLPTLRSIEC